MASEFKKVFFVEVTVELYGNHADWIVPLWWIGKDDSCYLSREKAIEATANDPDWIRGLAYVLARKRYLNGKFKESDCFWSDMGCPIDEMTDKALAYYKPLFDSLRQAVLTEGQEGREYIFADVDFNVPFHRIRDEV
jgi:hypothetical protein